MSSLRASVAFSALELRCGLFSGKVSGKVSKHMNCSFVEAQGCSGKVLANKDFILV